MVVPSDTNPFDTFAQLTGELALAPTGETHTEDKIVVNPRRIDFWFRADPAKAPAPGLLGQMVRYGTHILEFYHQSPNVARWRECMQKQVALQSREGGEFPTLWVISGGSPGTLIKEAELRGNMRWPKGIYEGAPAYRVRLVVTSELPETPDTLLLRLWSAGKTLERAKAELYRLPQTAWEWRVVQEAVVALERTALYAENQEGMAMIEDYRKAVEAWKEEVWLGGRQEGEQIALHKALETVYTSRFGILPDALRNQLQQIQAVDRLQMLIGAFASRSQEELEALLKG